MQLKPEEIMISEISSYTALLFRKGLRYRILETAIFIIGVAIAYAFFGENNLPFKLTAIAIAILTVGGAPFLYRSVLRPVYTLTKDTLWVSIRGKAEGIPLIQVKPSHDLRYMYYLNGKKKPLMVSDQFLEVLNQELWRIRHTQKQKKKESRH